MSQKSQNQDGGRTSGELAANRQSIAARAGVSPGTLYQFFPSKQAMAEALANEYAAQNQALHERVFDVRAGSMPLRKLIDRLVGPFLEVRRNAPGFEALFVGSVVSRELAERSHTLHQQLKQRVARLIHLRGPRLNPDAVEVSAETTVQIVKGLLPLALNGNAKQRRDGERELKLVSERYLAPLDRTEQVPGSPLRTKRRR